MHTADNVDALLKARAEIDEQLRRHKNAMTVLFTDVVGSTRFFERNGDTAGLVMIHRHDELAARAIQQFDGKVIKTIGDSAMAEFPDPASAVRAAVEIERQFLKLNLSLAEDQRVEVRIGIHTGVGFRKGNDLFGDVVNVTARIVKRTAPAQILISHSTQEAIAKEADLHCRWLNKLTIDGRTEKEDIFEVIWTDLDAYRDVQDRLAATSNIPPRYEILSQIGSGGTGIVYKVRDLETSEVVALKILKPEIASDPDAQENFKRELCLARKITHKNVCRIYEFSRLNGTAYTSMELIEGESLSSRLFRVGSLPVEEAIQIARQISAGLREAHVQGIVHRDLKPGNIMLDRNGTVKIMDFGIARMIQRDGPMTGTIMGTPAYMAPEQAELKPVGPCTDIYALGLVLYEMITGVAAFSGDTPVAVAIKQIQEYPKRPREIVPQLSRGVDAVIMKCLQKDSAKRYRSVDEFENALMRAARTRPVSPWEAAVDCWLARAESEIGNRLKQGADNAIGYMERQDWRALLQIKEEPQAMLGVAGMIGALIVFLFVGGWKTPTISAGTMAAASQYSSSPLAAANHSTVMPTMLSAQNSMAPIASRQVDLYENLRTDNAKPAASDSGSPIQNLATQPVKQPEVSPKPSQTATRVKSPVAVKQPKAKLNAGSSAQSQLSASSAQPDNAAPVDASLASAQELATSASQPSNAPEPVFEKAYAGSKVEADSAPGKVLQLYFEVGTFKEQAWAISAVDKLTQLGFHAVLVHKNLLWSQSYHVQVGPYSNQKDFAEARQNLTAQGFKPHPVN